MYIYFPHIRKQNLIKFTSKSPFIFNDKEISRVNRNLMLRVNYNFSFSKKFKNTQLQLVYRMASYLEEIVLQDSNITQLLDIVIMLQMWCVRLLKNRMNGQTFSISNEDAFFIFNIIILCFFVNFLLQVLNVLFFNTNY